MRPCETPSQLRIAWPQGPFASRILASKHYVIHEIGHSRRSHRLPFIALHFILCNASHGDCIGVVKTKQSVSREVKCIRCVVLIKFVLRGIFPCRVASSLFPKIISLYFVSRIFRRQCMDVSDENRSLWLSTRSVILPVDVPVLRRSIRIPRNCKLYGLNW